MTKAGEAARRRLPVTPRRRRLFLRALAASGNVTDACEVSGVSRTAAYARRAADAGFAAAWDAAAAKGAAAAEAMTARRDEWPEGFVVRRNKKGCTQIAAARPGTWSPRRQAMFLRHLAATCNVRGSARAAGLTATEAYRHRRAYPAFTAAWDAALKEGHQRLEFMLVEKATNAVDFTAFAELPADEAADARAELAAQGYDAWFAMHLLKAHKASVRGEPHGRRGAAVARVRTLEELREGILRKIEAIRNAREPDGEGD